MTNTDRDDLDALAGEFVLGSLPADEFRAAEARYAADPAFRAAVSAWEERLQPIADSAGDVAPPPGTFERIAARLGDEPALSVANVVALRRQLRRWRAASAVAAAAAVVLAVFVVVDLAVPPPPSEFVAVLTTEGAPPAFVATVDVENGTLSIRRVVPEPPPERSYELWAIEPNATPVSLGLVDEARYSRGLEYAPDGLTLAVSLEPKGGSPTGEVTGPVVFSGALIAAE